MKRLVMVLSMAIMLSSCATVERYIKRFSEKPSLLIGYQTVQLRENIPPLIEIRFKDNETVISESDFDEIGTKLTKNTYYVVEATAGGFSKQSQRLAQLRVSEIIKVLEAYNIKSKDIYVAEYTAEKPGRRGYIYSISY